MTQLLNHRYRILKTIGDGGFGQTFLAEDTHLPSARRCVIKQLKPVVDPPQMYQLVKERFQREAAILEELGEGNPQIPKLYAYFESDGLFYLVQEWIDGVTLTQQMQSRAGQPQQNHEAAVKALLISLLTVLDYIHRRGIIHRDIKPDNIMLRRSTQQPVLIDFGAVKETVQTVVNSQGQPTQSIIIGTPGYMPPEQAVGKPVFASDLYSLGLTAIYLLTGKAPQQLQVHPQTGDYVWQVDAPQISPEFADVLDRAIQSHARDRYPTAATMRSALQGLQASSSPELATTVMAADLAFVPSTHPSTLPSTVAVSSQPSTPLAPSSQSSATGQRNNGIILGSFIASGLIGAAVILGLVLRRPAVNPPPLPDAANASPSPIDAPSSPTSNPTTNSSQTPLAIPTPTIPQPDVPTPSLPQPTPASTSNATDVESPNVASSDIMSSNEFAWLTTRPVTDVDLAGKTAFELDILRNAIFAMHGRRFMDEALQAYFNSRPWYTPIYSPDEFPNELLSTLEKQNVQIILEYQERNGLK
jgi:serine/threonine-protein kinase